MQPAKQSFWRTIILRIRHLAGLDLPLTSHFVDQPIVIEYDLDASATALTDPIDLIPGGDNVTPALAPARRSDLLLAPRLASVSRLNIPSARKGERARGTSANRPVKAEIEPVKARKAEAWVLARKTAKTAPSAKIVVLAAGRRPRSAARSSLSLAA